jgi:tetratricopeptide (TPR) repeat protein
MTGLGLALVSLGVFVALLVRERNATERERAAAERVVQFLVGSFSVADPSRSQGKQVTARDILDNGVARIESELKEQPETMGRMLATMGEVYAVIGEQKLAQRLLERSVGIQSGPLQRAAALKQLGVVQTSNGDWATGERTLRQAAALMKDSGQTGTAYHGDALSALAANLRTQGKLDDAEATVQDALAIMRRVRGEQHPDTSECIGIWAQIRYDRRDFAGALERHRQALAIEEKAFGAIHRRVALRLNLIGAALLQMRQFKPAEESIQRALEVLRKLYGDTQQDVATAWNDLSVIYSRQGKYDESAKANMEALRIYRAMHGDGHPFVAAALSNLAQTRRRQGDVEKAAGVIAEALEVAMKTAGPDNMEYAFSAFLSGVLALDRGRFGEAEVRLRESVEIRTKGLGPENDSVLTVEGYLAIALQAKGDAPAARAIYERLLAVADKRKQADSLWQITGLIGIAETSADAADWRAAEGALASLRPMVAKANAPCRARIALMEGRWHWAARRRPEAEAAFRKAQAVAGLDAALWRWLASRGLAQMKAGAEIDEGRRFSGYVPALRMFSAN